MPVAKVESRTGAETSSSGGDEERRCKAQFDPGGKKISRAEQDTHACSSLGRTALLLRVWNCQNCTVLLPMHFRALCVTMLGHV